MITYNKIALSLLSLFCIQSLSVHGMDNGKSKGVFSKKFHIDIAATMFEKCNKKCATSIFYDCIQKCMKKQFGKVDDFFMTEFIKICAVKEINDYDDRIIFESKYIEIYKIKEDIKREKKISEIFKKRDYADTSKLCNSSMLSNIYNFNPRIRNCTKIMRENEVSYMKKVAQKGFDDYIQILHRRF